MTGRSPGRLCGALLGCPVCLLLVALCSGFLVVVPRCSFEAQPDKALPCRVFHDAFGVFPTARSEARYLMEAPQLLGALAVPSQAPSWSALVVRESPSGLMEPQHVSCTSAMPCLTKAPCKSSHGVLTLGPSGSSHGVDA